MALPAQQGKALPLLSGCLTPPGPAAGPPSHPWLAAGSTVPSRPLGAFGSSQTPLGQVPSTRTKAESPRDGPGSWGRVQLPAQLLPSAGNQRGTEVKHPLAAFVLPRAAVGWAALCLSGVLWWLSQAGCQGEEWGASISILLEGPLPALSLQGEPASLTPLVPAGQHCALAVAPGSALTVLPSEWHSKL